MTLHQTNAQLQLADHQNPRAWMCAHGSSTPKKKKVSWLSLAAKSIRGSDKQVLANEHVCVYVEKKAA